ncbi:hypothetical protein D9M72_594180 [compost metagenome]
MKKPRQNTKTMMKAPSTPGTVCGTKMFQNVRIWPAPKPRAASSTRGSRRRMVETSGKMANGTMKCTMPITTPSSLRVSCSGSLMIPSDCSQPLSMPLLRRAISQPKARTSTDSQNGMNTQISTMRCQNGELNTQQYAIR